MPSQEEYLDNLLKGIETENMETEVTKEPKMTGTEEETAKAPETPEPVEEIGTQVDMSDMDDLLQSALDAQKADSSEQETEASQPVAENTAILPEETASMSEDEINRLLQQSQEQSGDAPAQESNDANDDLIKMLENADDEGLSNILDQVTPETAQPEETAEREEDNGKRGKKKKEKKKKAAKGPNQRLRHRTAVLIVLILVIGFGAIVARLGYLTTIQSGKLQQAAVEQQLMDRKLPAKRGTIYDSNGKVLAESASVWQVVMSPANIDTDKQREAVASGLSEILGLDKADLLEKTKQNSYYVVVKRQIESDTRTKILELIDKLKKDYDCSDYAVQLQDDYKRYYPNNDLASNVIGFTGSDEQGLEGIEYEYDTYLKGTAGRIVTAKNSIGTERTVITFILQSTQQFSLFVKNIWHMVSLIMMFLTKAYVY